MPSIKNLKRPTKNWRVNRTAALVLHTPVYFKTWDISQFHYSVNDLRVPLLKSKFDYGKLRLELCMCKRERRVDGLRSKILREIENLIYGTDNLREHRVHMVISLSMAHTRAEEIK
jgi:hypothetical protein